MNLPNCHECGHNKEVVIVEGLADTDDGVLYRVCCRACGGDWTWEHKLEPLTMERLQQMIYELEPKKGDYIGGMRHG